MENINEMNFDKTISDENLKEIGLIIVDVANETMGTKSIIKSLKNSIIDIHGEQNQEVSIHDIENVLKVALDRLAKQEEHLYNMGCEIGLKEEITKQRELRKTA